MTSKLQSLQKNSPNIRNICILAHVDHGRLRTRLFGSWINEESVYYTIDIITYVYNIYDYTLGVYVCVCV